MALTFELDPAFGRPLHDGITALWADVTDAGGAVGFVPPAKPEEIRSELLKHLAAITEGRTRLLVGRDEGGRVAATAFLARPAHRLMTHWVLLHTVMVHPRLQGRGLGRELMAAAAEAARGMEGVEAIRLGCRGGTGADRFYASCGYREVGRVPGAIRVAPGDDRDDITMLLPLLPPPRGGAGNPLNHVNSGHASLDGMVL
ncbi:GNAT family N-acetyltransferase [Streptomyces fulvorobeus]|uniref:N-acetyltransferase n=1 Tax=Streptomyces fulvorobeus TaxID=284028 RepID=A0A7J0C5V2_9ACTN|nr:GNAT family N-acetyltransferase [Streptomyces fulvorobeus]NYE41411.1 GNAT superfamily N-acetyltransferase [Streptomyces fulvorobeus]GFM97768.1 N-acetyltransferase [Streptomyces fulvorobeus]